MDAFQRAHVQTLCSRLTEPPRHLIALFGPRQTGKTTIVQQALSRIDAPSRYLPVDGPDQLGTPLLSRETEATFPMLPGNETEWLVHHWKQARYEADRSPRGFVLALDEVQKIPNWSETVKGLWDLDRSLGRQLHVIVLGSAPLLVQSGLSESLAGRFERISVSHWSLREMTTAFNLDMPAFVYFGGYPGAAGLVQDERRWRDYITGAIVEPNIERDILSMSKVDKPALLKRLFELGAFYSGQILSYTKMVGQLQDAGNTTTLARYLDLLSSAGLLSGLPNWSNHLHRRRASSPKLNVHNTALMTAGSGYSFAEAQADRTFRGRMVESAVGAHLLNTASTDMHLYYWRHRSLEVDFVIQKGARLVAVEVKSGQDRGSSSAGLREFERRFSPHRSLLVGDNGIPVNEFLSVPSEEWFGSA